MLGMSSPIDFLPQSTIYSVSDQFAGTLFFAIKMQLFLSDFQVSGNRVRIENTELLQQMRKVLRLKVGDQFALQKIQGDTVIRLTCKLSKWNNDSVDADVVDTQEKLLSSILDSKAIIIAMPNKRQKAELMVQKLSEIGIQNIYFWPSDRSVIKEKNSNKWQRLLKISQEATEQSWSWVEPNVEFITDISALLPGSDVTIFDIRI